MKKFSFGKTLFLQLKLIPKKYYPAFFFNAVFGGILPVLSVFFHETDHRCFSAKRIPKQIDSNRFDFVRFMCALLCPQSFLNCFVGSVVF